ncbi:MAG TPA: serine hydrolase [Longimicrobiaceae bacterium]|nr:serine hydrolase [Longimicrobiaceae bacterium]
MTTLLLAGLLVLGGCGERGFRAAADVEGSATSGPGREAVATDAGTWERPEPAAAPATVGLDSILLAAAYDRAGQLPRLRSLLVARQGELLGERYYRGAAADRPANVKSVSKSVISALVGIAIAEGHLTGLDQRIVEFFPTQLRNDPDPRKREITIEHLVSMRGGLESTSFGNYGQWVSSRNWVQNALARPMVADPGTRMIYSTGSTHLLSAILTRSTGMSTLEYARRRFAEPLGIRIRPWPTDPQGIYFGGNDMLFTPREMVRIGELYLNGGRFGGRQIVPEEWVRKSFRVRTRSPWNNHGYGYGWWIRQAGRFPVHFAWGYGGQYIFIVPELELVVVTTSDASAASRDGGHLAAIHDLVDRYLVPAAVTGGPAG